MASSGCQLLHVSIVRLLRHLEADRDWFNYTFRRFKHSCEFWLPGGQRCILVNFQSKRYLWWIHPGDYINQSKWTECSGFECNGLLQLPSTDCPNSWGVLIFRQRHQHARNLLELKSYNHVHCFTLFVENHIQWHRHKWCTSIKWKVCIFYGNCSSGQSWLPIRGELVNAFLWKEALNTSTS